MLSFVVCSKYVNYCKVFKLTLKHSINNSEMFHLVYRGCVFESQLKQTVQSRTNISRVISNTRSTFPFFDILVDTAASCHGLPWSLERVNASLFTPEDDVSTNRLPTPGPYIE